MPLVLKTAPTVEPVTTAEMEAHLVLASGTDTALLTLFEKAVRSYGENLTRRQFVEATYQLVMESFPSGSGLAAAIELPLPPLQDVESITYLDVDGNEQTLAVTEYVIDMESLVGRVYPVDSWPSTDTDRHDAVVIEYVTGYPLTGSPATTPTTPEAIETWMLMRIATLYEQREAHANNSIVEIPRSFLDGLLDAYVIPRVI